MMRRIFWLEWKVMDWNESYLLHCYVKLYDSICWVIQVKILMKSIK